MTLAQWADVATLVSGGAVAVSLLYLAIQIRQSARHQRGAISHGRAEHMQALIQSATTSPELMDSILRGWAGDPTLGRIGYHQFYWFVFAILVMFEDTYRQFEQGMIGRPVYNSAVKATRFHLGQPGARAVWRLARGSFEDDFVQFVDDLAAQTPVGFTGDTRAAWLALVAEGEG